MTKSSSEPSYRVHYRAESKYANVLAVVILSGVFLVIFFAISTLFVGRVGTKLLPRIHARNVEPRSQLAQPAPQAVDAQMNVA